MALHSWNNIFQASGTRGTIVNANNTKIIAVKICGSAHISRTWKNTVIWKTQSQILEAMEKIFKKYYEKQTQYLEGLEHLSVIIVLYPHLILI